MPFFSFGVFPEGAISSDLLPAFPLVAVLLEMELEGRPQRDGS